MGERYGREGNNKKVPERDFSQFFFCAAVAFNHAIHMMFDF